MIERVALMFASMTPPLSRLAYQSLVFSRKIRSTSSQMRTSLESPSNIITSRVQAPVSLRVFTRSSPQLQACLLFTRCSTTVAALIRLDHYCHSIPIYQWWLEHSCSWLNSSGIVYRILHLCSDTESLPSRRFHDQLELLRSRVFIQIVLSVRRRIPAAHFLGFPFSPCRDSRTSCWCRLSPSSTLSICSRFTVHTHSVFNDSRDVIE
ncbi:hypothetical protein BDZ89DRAFT_551911 [Hymenopellis radicata]|nr:hypothetical protein BDZ89DRAFT_551911 [Hymenopellis radicata]